MEMLWVYGILIVLCLLVGIVKSIINARERRNVVNAFRDGNVKKYTGKIVAWNMTTAVNVSYKPKKENWVRFSRINSDGTDKIEESWSADDIVKYGKRWFADSFSGEFESNEGERISIKFENMLNYGSLSGTNYFYNFQIFRMFLNNIKSGKEIHVLKTEIGFNETYYIVMDFLKQKFRQKFYEIWCEKSNN